MKISLVLLLILVASYPLSNAFEVKITCAEAKAPVTVSSVIVTISFSKEVHGLTPGFMNYHKFTLSDMEGGPYNYTVKATFTDIANWGESRIWLAAGRVSTPPGEERNEASNVVGITYGPSLSDDFTSCYEIKQKHPNYTSGLYYTSYDTKYPNTLTYCEQERAGGGWTLFYANSGNPNMKVKKSYNQYSGEKKFFDFSDNYWSYDLHGMVNYELLNNAVSLMGVDLGSHWNEGEYGYITFSSNAVLKAFLSTTLVQGTSCQKLPNDDYFRYRNSNGVSYLVNTIMNWMGEGYGWQDCIPNDIPDTAGSNVEAYPRHILYMINSDKDDQRTRGIFGFNNGDPDTKARYFLRRSSASVNPTVDLMPKTPYVSNQVPVAITIAFSDSVSGLKTDGIQCTKCKVLSVSKSTINSAIWYADIEPEQFDTTTKMTVVVKANAAQTSGEKGNLESAPMEITLSDDLQVIKYPSETECPMWLESWKSNKAGTMIVEFGVSVGSEFSVILSPTNGMSGDYYKITLAGGNNLKKLRYIKHKGEEDKELKAEDIEVTFGKGITIIWIKFDNGKFTVGEGITPGKNEKSTVTDEEEEKLAVQYASFCGSTYSVEYYYIFVGPKGSSTGVDVVVTSSSPNPTADPFTVAVTTSQNIQTYDKTKLMVDGSNQWISDVTVVNPRQISFKVTPQVENDKNIGISVSAECFTDQTGVKSSASKAYTMKYQTSPLKVKFTTESDAITTIPVVITMTWNRAVKDFDGGLYSIQGYSCMIYYFNKISDTVSTILVVPESDKLILELYDDDYHDMNGNGCVYSRGEFNISGAKTITVDADTKFYTWMDSWRSAQSGIAYAKFTAYTDSGISIMISNQKSIGTERYTINIGWKDENGQPNVNRIYKGDELLKEVIHNFDLTTAGTKLFVYQDVGQKKLRIGNGTEIDSAKNTFITLDDADGQVQYFSFGSNDNRITYDIAEIGPTNGGLSPSCTIEVSSDPTKKMNFIPLGVTIVFSIPVANFAKEKIEVNGGTFYEEMSVINATSYLVYIYPNRDSSSVTIMVPANAAIGQTSSIPSTASNTIVYNLEDEIVQVRVPPLKNEFKIFYKSFKFADTQKLSLLFDVFSAGGGVRLALSTNNQLNGNYYLFEFGDKSNSKNAITLVKQDGSKQELASYDKATVLPNTYTKLWVSIDSGRIRMGAGDVVDLQPICDTTQLDIIPVSYFTLGSNNDVIVYSNIIIGPVKSGFYVTLKADYKQPLDTFPVHVEATWSEAARDFSIDSISSINCKIFNFYNKDNGKNVLFTFDAIFAGNNDCSFMIGEGKVRSQSGSRNQASDSIVIYHSSGIYNYDITSPNKNDYKIFYENWKSNSTTELYSTFSMSCKKDAYVGLAKDENAEVIYQIVLGADDNSRLLIQRYNRKTGVATALSQQANPVCAEGQYVDFWVRFKIGNYRDIDLGSGTNVGSNYLISGYDTDDDIDVRYISFANNEDNVYIKSILVGPGSGDTDPPKPSIYTSSEGTFTSIPVSVSIAFSEPVTQLVRDSIQVTNAKIVDFYGYTTYTVRLMPISTSSAMTVKLPKGAVKDMTGNPSVESDVLSITFDPTAVFDYEMVESVTDKYMLWLDQWKSSTAGNIEATFSLSYADDFCVGILSSPQDEYPIFDVCYNHNGETGLVLRNVTGTQKTILKKVTVDLPYDYYGAPYYLSYSDNNNTIKFAKGTFQSHEVILEYNLVNVTKQPQYVSFTSSDGWATFSSIMVTPYTGGRPAVSIESLTPLPSTVSPIKMKATFSLAPASFTKSTLTVTNGEIINLSGSGSIYTFDFLAYGNGTSTIQLLENKVFSRGRYGNVASSPVSVSYGDSITDYECPSLYSNFIIKSPVWRTNSYGTLWTTFSVKCSKELIIRFSPWLQGGFPNYLIKLGNNENIITRVEAKKSYEKKFESRPICNPYAYFDYWISQENSEIAIGTGNKINENKLWTYTESQAVPSHYVSFSSTSSEVSYKNIKVGPSDASTLECFLYSDVTFPTNITNIPVYVQWNKPVTDFTISSIQALYANVDNFEKLDDNNDFYKFIMTPSKCGFSSVYVKEGAVTVDGVVSKASVPLYAEYCNQKPVPSLTTTSPSHYSAATPFTIRITFTTTVYGFDIGDFEYPNYAWLLSFRSDSETSYILEVAPLGNATENVKIRVKPNSLTDLYGNLNEASQTITLPLYNTIVDTFTISTSLYNEALILKQWSTGLEMNSWITFNGRCTKDLFIVFSKELNSPDSDRIRIIVGGADNSRTQIIVRGVEHVVKQIGPCQPGTDVKMWAKFEKKLIQFGTGELGENVIAGYEANEDLPFKYLGLSNWQSPVYYRNIKIGPADAIAPRTRTVANIRTQITSANPIHVNVTFTNDCLNFDSTQIKFTENGKISEVKQLSNTIYAFDYTGVEGENYIDIPKGICNDSSGRPNDAASPFYYTYQAGVLTGEFSTQVPSITATAPIAITITFSSVPADFSITSIQISGSDGYLGELVKVSDDQYTFNTYITDTEASYLTIPANTIHDSLRNGNLQIGPFALPRYADSVTTFIAPENRNDYPYFASQWTGVQRGNVNSRFRAKCTDGIIIGISHNMSPEDKSGYIVFMLGMSNNKVSTINGKTKYAEKNVGFCNGDNYVDVWVSYSNGKAAAGTGATVGTDTKIEATIPESDRAGFKFVYFSSHTAPVTYSAISIGPEGIVRPRLTVDTARGTDGAIAAMMSLTSEGTAWCVALKNPSTRPSIIQMLRGTETKISTESSSVVVKGLLGGTRYDLWCYAEDSEGVSITNDNIDSAKQTVTTSGSASYPIITIKNIVGRSTSIYIEFEMTMTGEMYAFAVYTGSSAPTIETVKSKGTKQLYVFGNPQSLTITDLDNQKSYDVYFYAESDKGSQPQEDVDSSKRTVRTDASCPIVDDKPCAGHGICNDGICECEYGYHDKDCAVTCPGTNFAGRVECAGHGTCQLNGKCQCDSSLYLGDGCNIQCPNDGIEACGGVSHGTCKFDGSKAWCECRDNWTGEQCTKMPRGPLGAGAIIGIICGSIVGLCIIGIGSYCYCSGPSVARKSTKKSKKSKHRHHEGDLLNEV